MKSSKEILIHKLSILLGFEDGVDDMLEHLLSIEDPADLLDYLQQLLGNAQDLRPFVDDVGRCQRGEQIHYTCIQNDKAENEVQKVAANLEFGKPKVDASEPQKEKHQQQPRQETKKLGKAPKVGRTIGTEKSYQKLGEKVDASLDSAAAVESSATLPSTKAVAPSKPVARGKAKIECGCFGNIHTALTNCLDCGRISCEKEGYDYCPFCGLLVEAVSAKLLDPEDTAVQQKNRLLQYDLSSAQRMVILDDQADHYTNTVSTWLNDEQQHMAAGQEQKRHDDLHKRKNIQLNLM